MYVVVLIIVSFIIAWILQISFKSLEVPGGYWNRFAGAIIGAFIGELILGNWGWMLAEFNVIAGIIGSFVIGWFYTYLFSKKKKSSSKTEA